MKGKKGKIKSLFGLREWFTKKWHKRLEVQLKREGGRGGRDKAGNGAKSRDGRSI